MCVQAVHVALTRFWDFTWREISWASCQKAASETTKPAFYLLSCSQKMADFFMTVWSSEWKFVTQFTLEISVSLPFFSVHFEFLGIKYLYYLLLEDVSWEVWSIWRLFCFIFFSSLSCSLTSKLRDKWLFWKNLKKPESFRHSLKSHVSVLAFSSLLFQPHFPCNIQTA